MISDVIGSVDVRTAATFCAVFLTALYLMRRKRRNLPPGPWGLPYLGHVFYFTGKGVRLEDVMNRWAKEYGGIFTVRFGIWRVVVLNKWDVVKEALVSKQNDFAGRPELVSAMLLTENGKDILFSNYGPVWKYHRKVAHTAIRTYATGRNLEKLISHSCNILTETLETESKSGLANIRPLFSHLSLNLAMGMCFGKHYSFEDEEFKTFSQITKEFGEGFGNGLPEDFFPIAKYFPLEKRNMMVRLIDTFKSVLRKQFEDHKQKFVSGETNDICDYLLQGRLDAMETDGSKQEILTDTHLTLTLHDIFGAGMDTITYTMVWLIIHMAQHVDIQKKMQKEIDNVVGKGQEPTLGHKHDLQYTEAVLYESIRTLSITPLAIPHSTMCDTSVGGYDVPKNSMVMINIAGLNHDKELWGDPENFRPERFIDENGRTYRPEGFIPFSAGRRVCLGEALAKNELMLIIPHIFGKYTFTAPPGGEFKVELEDVSILQMPKEFHLQVTPRYA